jgi:hypothetical protein
MTGIFELASKNIVYMQIFEIFNVFSMYCFVSEPRVFNVGSMHLKFLLYLITGMSLIGCIGR